jgi:hypothetical protein
LDWKNNPDSFEYKLSEGSEIQIGNIGYIKEFGIDDNAKFVRNTVKINRSSDRDATLEFSREVVSKEEELFLKVLVEGKAILYYYEEGDLRRFFYTIDNCPVKQLVYKRYRKSNRLIGENTQFRQELLNNLKCDGITQGIFAKMKYKGPSLVALFKRYNKCIDPNYVASKNEKRKTFIHLSLRPGVTFSKTRTENIAGALGQVTNVTEFDSKTNFRLGLELELVFPFNNNKWSILLEPTYRNYQSSSEDNGGSFVSNLEIDYTSIEFTIGVRHSFYLNDSSKLFLTGYILNDMEMDSRLIRNIGVSSLEVKINPLSNFGIGLGYKFNNKISAEFRFDSPRELFRNSLWTSDFNNISLILGYTIL